MNSRWRGQRLLNRDKANEWYAKLCNSILRWFVMRGRHGDDDGTKILHRIWEIRLWWLEG